jgi:hypothetical protein
VGIYEEQFSGGDHLADRRRRSVFRKGLGTLASLISRPEIRLQKELLEPFFCPGYRTPECRFLVNETLPNNLMRAFS